MKKIALLIIAIPLLNLAFCQTKVSKEEKLKAEIIALEKAGWEAWKNKNTIWFKTNTTEECIWISSEGISDKAQMMKSTQTGCNVKSVSIENFKFLILNQNTVLLTYVANQNGYCDDKKLTEKIRASVNYIKRGEKWLEASYMETPMIE